MTTIVTSTGTKGLLQWLKSEQPDFYAYLSPQLLAMAQTPSPRAMSGFGCPQGMRGFADGYSSYATGATPDVSIDAGVNPGFTDLTVTPATSDAVAASSSAPTSTALATTISALANGYSSATLTAAQLSANNTLLQTNLQRAQSGLPPLTMSQAAGGGIGLTSNSGLLLLGVAVIAAFALGGKKTA